jgi:hypothetical protein
MNDKDAAATTPSGNSGGETANRRLSVCVWKSAHVYIDIDPDSMTALYSLMQQMYRTNERFVLCCEVDDRGQITALFDNLRNQSFRDTITFYPKTCDSFFRNEIPFPMLVKKLRYCGVQEIDMDRSYDHQHVDFPYLREIMLTEEPQHFFSSSWFKDKDFPTFDTLDLRNFINTEKDLMHIQSLDSRFAKRVRHLRLFRFDLGTLSLETLSRFPNLHTLHLPRIDIDFLAAYVERGDAVPLDSLCRLNFGYYGSADIQEFIETVPSGKQILLQFLKIFHCVVTLNYNYFLVDPDIRYALIVNRVGRRLVESSGHGGGRTSHGTDNNKSKESLPCSVWPLVLKRAQSTRKGIPDLSKSETITGLYYLLREGPVLYYRGPRGQTGKRKRN